MTDLPASTAHPSSPASPGRPDVSDEQWVKAIVGTALSTYYRPDDDPATLRAQGELYWQTLRGLPREAIRHAVVSYCRDNDRRKPTPGDLYNRATASLPSPRLEPYAPPSDALSLPRPPKVDPDTAERLLASVGFTPKRFRDAAETPMLGADLHLEPEDRERLEAERVARAARIRELSKPSEAQIERVRWSNPLMAEAMRAAGHRPSWERESEHPSGEAA